MANQCKKNDRVAITGPKGCGKTFTVAVLFALWNLTQKEGIFLSARSFSSNNRSYFEKFIAENFADNKKEDLLKKLDSDVLSALKSILEHIQLVIFADFSQFTKETKESNKHFEQLVEFLQFAISRRARIILSVSSGIGFPHDSGISQRFTGCLSSCYNDELTTGFTDEEASRYLTKKGVKLRAEEVKHISGTNPYLLSLFSKDDRQSLPEYKSKVKFRMQQLLLTHFSNLGNRIETLDEYFLHEKWTTCSNFVYYANRGDALLEPELKKYYDTVLYQHKLTVLHLTLDNKIEEDQDDGEDAASTSSQQASLNPVVAASNISTSNRQERLVIRWNFPILGEMFINVIENFIEKTTLVHYCNSVPTFAGNWYEFLFFKYLKKEKTIMVCTADNHSVQLYYEGVVEMENDATLQNGKIYEMKAFYPIVDAVGYLKDQSENYWLVFIQVSLSCYRDHRSLCDLFHRAPPKANVPNNCSLFSYYRNQYSVMRCFEKAILLYISPKEMYCEGQDLLPDLGEEISKLTDTYIKKTLKYGGLSSDSTFHIECKNTDYFKQYYSTL